MINGKQGVKKYITRKDNEWTNEKDKSVL
jgi:hypothetical protein